MLTRCRRIVIDDYTKCRVCVAQCCAVVKDYTDIVVTWSVCRHRVRVVSEYMDTTKTTLKLTGL